MERLHPVLHNMVHLSVEFRRMFPGVKRVPMLSRSLQRCFNHQNTWTSVWRIYYAHFGIQFRIASKWLNCVGTQLCIYNLVVLPNTFQRACGCDVLCGGVLFQSRAGVIVLHRGGDAGGCGYTPQDRHTREQDLCPPSWCCWVQAQLRLEVQATLPKYWKCK